MLLTPETAGQLPDDELVVRAVQGDEVAKEVAKEVLIGRYGPRIRSKARAYLREGPDDAEDAAQEALVHWIQQWHKYDPDRGTFDAFTNSVVTNKIRGKYRELRSRPSWEIEERYEYDHKKGRWVKVDPEDHKTPRPDKRIISEEVKRVIWECLGTLDCYARRRVPRPRCTDAQLLIEHYVEGLSYDELAAKYGSTAQALRQRAHRARRRFQKCIEQRAANGDEVAEDILEWLDSLPDAP